ncbi:MAG TPA: hypothetical protein VFE45_03025 [Coriobacteriia bacterium]|nr:hypothetical protein [Coriobacteriia bacterium]
MSRLGLRLLSGSNQITDIGGNADQAAIDKASASCPTGCARTSSAWGAAARAEIFEIGGGSERRPLAPVLPVNFEGGLGEVHRGRRARR